MRKISLFILLFFGGVSCQTTPKSTETVEDQSYYKMNLIRVALAQSEKLSPAWEPQQQDCAGFIRFVYRTAIGTPGSTWLDWNGKEKTAYANAELLVSRNFSKLSDEMTDSVKTGDILVFKRDGQKKEDQWHMMMVMESPWEKSKWLVIYHNGSHGENAGVKKLWLTDLQETEQSDWKPIKENKNFVGIYRWNAWVNR